MIERFLRIHYGFSFLAKRFHPAYLVKTVAQTRPGTL